MIWEWIGSNIRKHIYHLWLPSLSDLVMCSTGTLQGACAVSIHVHLLHLSLPVQLQVVPCTEILLYFHSGWIEWSGRNHQLLNANNFRETVHISAQGHQHTGWVSGCLHWQQAELKEQHKGCYKKSSVHIEFPKEAEVLQHVQVKQNDGKAVHFAIVGTCGINKLNTLIKTDIASLWYRMLSHCVTQ